MLFAHACLPRRPAAAAPPSPPQACNRQNLYCVPLYDSLGEHAVEYIIKHSESTAVFCQTEKLGTLAKSLPHVRPLGCPPARLPGPAGRGGRPGWMPRRRLQPARCSNPRSRLLDAAAALWHERVYAISHVGLQVDGLIKTVVYWGKGDAAAAEVRACRARRPPGTPAPIQAPLLRHRGNLVQPQPGTPTAAVSLRLPPRACRPLQEVKGAGAAIYSYQEFLELGRSNPADACEAAAGRAMRRGRQRLERDGCASWGPGSRDATVGSGCLPPTHGPWVLRPGCGACASLPTPDTCLPLPLPCLACSAA